MTQAQLRHRLGHPQRLTDVELGRAPRGHRAEPARARAHVAQDHEGGGASAPAVEDVGAACLFAHRVQAPLGDERLELLEVRALADLDADPRRDGSGHQRRGVAHSLRLAGVHPSRPFRIVERNWPAIIPSTMRWSKLRHTFIMWRTAIPSPTTTGRFTIDSVVRIAACG